MTQPDAAQLRTLVGEAARGTLTTRVVDVLPREEAAEAHRRAEAGGFRGKIVLTF